MLDPSWLTVPELKWMLLGEKLNGGAMLYADILDNTAPLSALAYRLLNLVAGRSPLAMHIAGTLGIFLSKYSLSTSLRCGTKCTTRAIICLLYSMVFWGLRHST
jgi:hypothetical protein